MEIHIKTIPHSRQRYETVGDYWIDRQGVIQIRVSSMRSEISEQLVAIHELVEVVMCKWRMMDIKEIDKFDKEFEAQRKEGNLDEPGFDPKSPYRNEHAIATAVELMICAHLNIPWKEYEAKVNSL
jgi:hypothetical protein